MEAQANIAEETTTKLISLLQAGSTATAVNLPQVELPMPRRDVHRILHLHLG